VDHLLDAAPNVTILATSRTPLDIAGEVRFRLKPLTAAPANTPPHRMLDVDAVRLFVSRATAARTDFALTEANAEAVGEITRRLDGLPLALELAAARTTTYAPADLLARLDERFSLLSTSERGVSDRHRTLAATLAWSVELLSAHARTLLARVSIFAGRFALDWAEDVCAFDDLSGSDVALLIDALVRASLLAATAVGDRTDYELLRTVRVYASGQLRERNEQATMERRRAQFLVRRLAMPDPIFQFSSRTDAYLRAVSILADDVRAALDWCLSTGDGETACALIANVYRWWNVTGRIVELVPLALTALSLPAPPTFARLVTHYALQIGLETGGAEMSERRRYADDMLALAEQLDEDNARALALYCQADFPMAAGDFGAAEEIFASAAAAATRAGSASLAATIRRSEAEAHAGNDDDVLANSLDLVLDEFRRTDDPYGLAVTLAVLAGAELGCGRIADGAAHAAEGWRISDAHGYAEVGWRHWTLLARAAAERGAGPTAARLLGALDAALVRAGGAVGAGQGGTGDRERALCRARELLGPARMAELADEGRALTAEALTSVLHDALTQATGCAVRDSNPER
jgi:predicted ATPase